MFRRFCIAFISISLSLILLAAGTVFVFDPFSVYHKYNDFTEIIYQMPYYQNTGIAKNASYDTLITGTSMTQNFRAWWFDDAFDCHAIRLSFDGGILSDFEALLDSAISNNHDLETIYFGLDNYIITSDSNLNDISNRVPTYLIDKNPLNDVKYLLNKDVLFQYIPTQLSYKRSETYDFYEMHCWDTQNPTYSEKSVLDLYVMPQKEDCYSEDYFSDGEKNTAEVLTAFVKENPNIQFVFFAPPYSVLYWYTLQTEGKLDATLSSMSHVYKALLQYPNVRLFYFQNDFDTISNLANYKDDTHYRTEINQKMLHCFSTDEYQLNSENCDSVLAEMKQYVLQFDYDKVFERK